MKKRAKVIRAGVKTDLKITLFIPCFVDVQFPQVAIAMVELLERLGHEVEYPVEQTCCGQPAFNMGYCREAKAVAELFLERFDGAEVIAVPSGSCAAMVKVFYRELFEGTSLSGKAREIGARTYEFSSLLVDKLGVTDVGASFRGEVAFHDGCHGLRELGVKSAPRKLLEHVQGLKLVEMAEAESCCGFGGTFSVKFPQISSAMAEVKMLSMDETGAEYLVSCDPSCLMQLQGYMDRQGRKFKCLHLAEVLNCR